jgi:hypothetical protein
LARVVEAAHIADISGKGHRDDNETPRIAW